VDYQWKSVASFAFLVAVLACSPSIEQWAPRAFVEGVPVASDLEPDEIDALSALGKACARLFPERALPTVIFVRSPNQKVPEVCKGPGCAGECADTWAEYPDVMDPEPRVPSEGYSGLETGGYVFVSRIGPRKDALMSLLVHEFAHWFCGCGHGPEHDAMEKTLWEAL